MPLPSPGRWIRVASLAVLPALSACSFVEAVLQPGPAATASPAPVSAEPPASPAMRPATLTPPRTARLPLPPPPAPGRAGETPDIEIKLVGLSRPQMVALLGPPAGESERSPAKVWQYLTGDCAVEVYFYLDVARNDFYALHYETRAPIASAAGALNGTAADGCLRRLHDARHTR